MENGKSRVKFAKRRAALLVWLRMLVTMRDLESAEEESLYHPVTGGRYFLGGLDCLDQTEFNDIEVREGWRPGFVVLVSE